MVASKVMARVERKILFYPSGPSQVGKTPRRHPTLHGLGGSTGVRNQT
jgi:hypothetical protein